MTAWSEDRAAFIAAARWFAAVARAVDAEGDRPALGEWSVRDLIGHTSRALLTVEAYLAAGAAVPPPVTVTSPAQYYRLAMASLGEPSKVAERGRAAGRDLGTDPAGAVAVIATRVAARIRAAKPGDLVATPVGGMRLADYLSTRTFELTVHTCDLAAALGVPASVPDAAAASGLRLLGDLAVEKGLAATLLLSATGRGPLPAGFTVL
ncbi:maleylpyruvate isomerase N-terminal domain-containing protein [Cryobacterium sp. PH31-AA6]|uniref:maleylpyruvate isomerase N-terminal domain-containing protein n=1 Tax=Cryobacterium sp. PH31-AA6 TaxID=3046205 RepID=UPI0024B98FB7|nr:maleylpyruvate isomerase N-terminal domain-containing protein [Cryobacterium sp. PH31-AA6]MDJ0322814.1 maleylpyruvate isomerase N-terminal domain-containing protein [Cryobacterium sp. PH31-AA6]